MTPYVEPGGSWRAFWLVAGALAVLLVLDLVLPGGDVPPFGWALALVAVLGVVAAGTLSARRMAVSVSRMARSRSSQPLAAAASTIAYSPLTW